MQSSQRGGPTDAERDVVDGYGSDGERDAGRSWENSSTMTESSEPSGSGLLAWRQRTPPATHGLRRFGSIRVLPTEAAVMEIDGLWPEMSKRKRPSERRYWPSPSGTPSSFLIW